MGDLKSEVRFWSLSLLLIIELFILMYVIVIIL